MRIVRPISYPEGSWTTNVVEVAPAVWAAGTTYAAGATVSLATGTARQVFTSLQGGNQGNAPNPQAATAWWKHTGDTYASYQAGATYGQLDYVIDPSAGQHQLYQSLIANNTGKALSDTTSWLQIGADNAYSALDQVVGTQASNPDSITYSIVAGGRVDSVAFFDFSAGTLRLTMTDPHDGVVFDQTVSTASPANIVDWYTYFFSPQIRGVDYIFNGLPPYAGATITATLTDPGYNVLLGALVMGQSINLGDTQYGASVGITDYSVKKADEFGNFSIVPRAYSKNGSFTLWVQNNYIDYLQALLAEIRATPVVWVGTDIYASTLVYGFYKDFNIEIAYFAESNCTLEIEGLT